MNQVIELEDC